MTIVKRITLSVAGLLFVGLCVMPSSFAGPGEWKGAWKDKEEAVMREADETLNLTDDQQGKFKALREEFKGMHKSNREELKAKQEALRQELDSADPDRGKVDSLVVELKALQGKMMDSRVDQVFKMRAILTPEQYTKFREIRKKHWEKMKEQRRERGEHLMRKQDDAAK